MGDNLCRSAPWAGWLAMLLAVAGCEREPERAPPAASVAMQPAPPSGPLSQLELGPGVLLAGAVRSPAKMIATIAKLRGSPFGGSGGDPADRFVRQLGLTSAAGLDPEKPVRFVVVDPREHHAPLLWAIAVADRQALLAALPADREGDGLDFAWTHPDGRTHLSLVADHAVIGKAPLSEHRELVTRLLGAEPSADLCVRIAAPALAEVLSKEPRWPRELVEPLSQLDPVLLEGSVDEAGMHLALTLHPRQGSELATRTTALGRAPLALLGRLPHAPLAVAVRVDPDGAGPWARSLAAWTLQLADGFEQAGEAYADDATAFVRATTGELAFAIHPVEGSGEPGYSVLIGLRDAQAAREAARRLRKVHMSPAIAARYQKLGVSLYVKAHAYRIQDVEVDTVTVIRSPRPVASPALGSSALTDLLGSHTALAGDLGIVTLGPRARETLSSWHPSKPPGVAPRKGLGAGAPKGTFALAYLEPRALARLIGLGDERQPQEPGAVRLVAAAGGGAIVVRLELPAGQLGPLGQVLSGLRRQLR